MIMRLPWATLSPPHGGYFGDDRFRCGRPELGIASCTSDAGGREREKRRKHLLQLLWCSREEGARRARLRRGGVLTPWRGCPAV